MQLIDVLGQVLLERIGQGRVKPRAAFYRNIHAGRQHFGARYQDDDASIADIVRSIRQGARYRLRTARSRAINGYPVRRLFGLTAHSNNQEFRHTSGPTRWFQNFAIWESHRPEGCAARRYTR